MTSRRSFLERCLAAGALGGLVPIVRAESEAGAARGPVLVVGQNPEPLALSTAASIDAGAISVSGKIFDRLFTLDLNGRLKPQLAVSGQISPDGLSVAANLRPGVTWHDGRPLTSKDVAYSITEVWRKYHARSTMAYANLLGVDTPDPLLAVLNFSRPVPYILSSLADTASEVVPSHLYAGRPVLDNPHNLNPVGTGPFRFVRWERGSYLALERNPHYWDRPKPYLSRVIFQFLPDAGAMVAALETGAIQYVSGDVPAGDIERLRADPDIAVQLQNAAFTPVLEGFAFNLDRHSLRDVRVRQALAHAIDREFILKNIYRGYGTLADSPVVPGTPFYTDEVPKYPFDLHKAAALLDAAGLRSDASGVRLSLTNDVMPPSIYHVLTAQFLRSTFARIGVKLELRTSSLGEYLERVFTRRDFDTITYSTGYDLDPALGMQRFYWSKTIQPGVPFSNATHYATPQVDHLLEQAQVEMDFMRRRQLYAELQRIVQRDVPTILILYPHMPTLYRRGLSDAVTSRGDNFAGARWKPA